MESALERGGFRRASSIGEADFIIVNTCAVRLDTEQRIVERLTELRSMYPGKRFVMAGCLVKARPGLIARVAPEASMLSPQNVQRVVEAVEALEKGSRLIALDGVRDTSWLPLKPHGVTATIMVQEGCLGDCSFCITKVARRQVKSYPPRLIVEAVEKLVSMGVVEVRLTGLDTAAYGVDLPGKPSIADLVNAILDRVEGDYMLRIGMMTPERAIEVIGDLLEAYRDRRVYKYLHIPVQSGDDRVLKIMNRRYTVDEYRELHRRIKTLYPEAMIATDIIVGHPGEDEEAFENTVKLVRELKFEKIHIAQYSVRPHTKAAAMPQISDSIKKSRSSRLAKIAEEIGYEIMARYKGKVLEALITEEGFREGSLVGRLNNYIPVIIPMNGVPLGSKVKVTIKDNTFFDLRGEVLEIVEQPGVYRN
jgi:MiaB/RimO family radical SAM methylthiotransferase